MSKNIISEIEHTADNALHIRAEDLAGLLRNAAFGMLGIMGLPQDKVGEDKRTIEVRGIDREDLLIAWLEELLYLIEQHNIGIGKMDIQVVEDTIAVAVIDEVPSMIPSKEIKAVTYHGIEILESEGGLEVTIVFDV